MKYILLTALLTAFSFLSTGCSNQTKEATSGPQSLKVAVWNIWHSNHVKYLQADKACEGVRGILKESNADVVLMIETYGSADSHADNLGYYHRLISSNLSIYSRYPITETYTFTDSIISTFNFGGVEINMNGKRVRLFDTWIHYLPDATEVPIEKTAAELIEWEKSGTRDEEIARVLHHLKPFIAESDSIPLIVGGDFNSHSHLDWTEATKNLYDHNGLIVEWPVSKSMTDAGFKDSFREMNPKVEENLGRTWMYHSETWTGSGYDIKDLFREDRIDYIYYQGNTIKADASATYYAPLERMLKIGNKEFYYGSDHGMVVTDFTIQ